MRDNFLIFCLTFNPLLGDYSNLPGKNPTLAKPIRTWQALNAEIAFTNILVNCLSGKIDVASTCTKPLSIVYLLNGCN